MKKKGLIIATIVMVLVLAVSLTTATYAWFTVTDVTTIEAFSVSVASGNAVNIGVKTNNTMAAGTSVTADDFMYGTVAYAPGTAGLSPVGLSGSAWSGGTTGMGASLDHNIVFGAQSKAVGAVQAANNATPSTVATNYTTIGSALSTAPTSGNQWFFNAANGDNTTLSNVTAAIANYDPDTESHKADYVYFLLGASPTKTLGTNELIIMLDGTTSSGTQCGILSAVHVCYRVTKQGEAISNTWHDAAIFPAANAYNTALTGVTNNLTAEEGATYVDSYSESSFPTNKAYCLKITGLSTAQGAIDQIEFFIYIAGTDSNCRNEATGAGGQLSIFFHTTDQS